MRTDFLEQCALTFVYRLVMHVAVEALHFSLSEQQVRMLQDLALTSKARASNAASSSAAVATGTRSSSVDSGNSAVPKEGIGVQSSISTTSTTSSSDTVAATAAAATAAQPSRATRLMTWWRGDSTADTAITAATAIATTTAGSTQSSATQGAAAGSRSSWRTSTAGATATATGSTGSAGAVSSTAQLLQQQAYHVASLSISRVTLTLLTVPQQLRTAAASPPLRPQQNSNSSSATVATTTTTAATAAAAATTAVAAGANADAHNTPPRHAKTLTAPAFSPSVLLISSIDENAAAAAADTAEDALSISVPVYGIGAVTVSTPATTHKRVMPHHQEPLLVLEVRHMCIKTVHFACQCMHSSVQFIFMILVRY
jgi:trimeric autotransporter adhesin